MAARVDRRHGRGVRQHLQRRHALHRLRLRLHVAGAASRLARCAGQKLGGGGLPRARAPRRPGLRRRRPPPAATSSMRPSRGALRWRTRSSRRWGRRAGRSGRPTTTPRPPRRHRRSSSCRPMPARQGGPLCHTLRPCPRALALRALMAVGEARIGGPCARASPPFPCVSRGCPVFRGVSSSLLLPFPSLIPISLAPRPPAAVVAARTPDYCSQ